MTNYYCLAYAEIPYATDEEYEWLTIELGKATNTLCTVCGNDANECICPDCYHSPSQPGNFVYRDIAAEKYFRIEGDEFIEGDVLTELVARYQIEFNHTEVWQMWAAYTCDKPACYNDFGGYAVLVYRGETYWCCPDIDAERLEIQVQQQYDFEQTLPVL